MGNTSMDFTVSSAYLTLLGNLGQAPWSNLVWVKGYIPKHAMCTWMAILKRLSTQDRLISWKHIPPDSKCSFSCWRICGSRSVVNMGYQHQMVDGCSWNDMQKLACSATIYAIWMERNARIFRKNSRSMDAILKDIKTVVDARMAWKQRRFLNCWNVT
ncbi:hypothetical protein OSB04_un000273 [Centaurea solstitialis]|uniref:Reverse transcriptase zinc-binding domain-containing protein n=1 Tax=Centaurea solstitialis TaxID=347529 RepID=A0AA38SIC5_9ASTR|nr:hypothetical protein OSB04_un000273 [Centaurea solstitialis]